MAATQGVWHYFYLDLKSSYVATLHKPCMEDVKMAALKLELRSAMPWRAEDLFPRHDSAPYVFMDRRPLSLLYTVEYLCHWAITLLQPPSQMVGLTVG